MNPTTCMRIVPKLVQTIAALGLIFLGVTGTGQDNSDRRSPPAALNLYADAASFQNNGAFDLAADEWEKFLKQFPSDPLIDKARHYAGVCRLQLKQYEKAAAHFELVAAKGKDFESAEDAHLNLGWCQYSLAGQGKADMYAKAAESFGTIVTLFPKGKYADQALFYRGESLYAVNQKPEAVKAYRQLVDQHPKSPLRPDGLYVLGVTHEELKQFKEAGAVYDIYIKECADNALITEVRMRKAETILQAGQFADAEKKFAEVAVVAGFEAADHALLRQAFCAAKQDKYVPAGKLYAKILADFPNSAYLAEATMSAGRCFFRGEDFAQAASWLQRIVDAGGADAPEAAHWLCRIHLQQNAADKVAELVDRMLPKAAGSAFLVNLKMDQADALYALSEWKAESVTKYLLIVTEHGDHELAPQALYNAAFACWELGRFKDGIQHAGAFLTKYKDDPLSADVKHVAAECHLKLGDHVAAETTYRDLVDHHADLDRAEQWKTRLGLMLHLQKKHAEAVKWLTTVLPSLKDKGQIAETQFLLGISHFHQNQFPDAAKAFAASRVADPKWRQADETMLFLARIRHKNGQTGEAVTSVRQMIADFPESALLDHAHYRLGEFQYAAGDYLGASEAYGALITKWPDSTFAPFAQYGQGWALLKEKKFAPAVVSFTALISGHPQHQLSSDAHFGRAMCQRQLKEYKKALADIAVYFKSNPPANNRADALHEKVLSEVALRDFANAAQTSESLLKEFPDYRNAASVMYELAFAYKELGKNDEVVATFARLANKYGTSPLAAEAHWRVGEAHFEKEEFDKALEQYTQAKSKSTPGEVNELATHKLGWSYFRLDKYNEALEQFQAQLKAYPSGSVQADGLFMQAECLFKLKKFEEAIPIFSAASQTTPTNSRMQVLTLLHGGQCAAELQQWEESIRFLDQIPEKFPKAPQLADALGKRGWAKQKLSRLDEAFKDYTQAVTASRGEAGAYAQYMIGEVQFERKQHEEAVRSFLRVMYGYGGENAVKEVKHWQAMAGYEAGRCAEVLKQTANAKKYYAFVVQRFGQHELAAKAKERLDALDKL